MKLKKWLYKLGIFLQKLFRPLHCFYSSSLLDGKQWPFWKTLSFFLSKFKNRDLSRFFNSLEHQLSQHLTNHNAAKPSPKNLKPLQSDSIPSNYMSFTFFLSNWPSFANQIVTLKMFWMKLGNFGYSGLLRDHVNVLFEGSWS